MIVLSRLDYCNAILAGYGGYLPKSTLTIVIVSMQQAQNAAARPIARTAAMIMIVIIVGYCTVLFNIRQPSSTIITGLAALIVPPL